jgi:hypothetical protein
VTVLPTATNSGVAARLCMRETGASVTVHILSAALTVIVACGFSYLEVAIGPLTMIGLAAS